MTRGRNHRLRRWLHRAALGSRLAGRFLVDLVAANLEQARLVLSWPLDLSPRWIHFETRLESATARTVLGTLISLTPGTLTCDLQNDILLIHALNPESDIDTVERIRQRFESLLLEMENA